ncbi:MAG: hypothetical protein ACK5VC_06620 [bacterium]
MLPAGMGGMATGWKGQSRPTLDGQVDLVTGKPLVQVTDLELPFGSTVFRLNRTRSSLTRSDDPGASRGNKWKPNVQDAWWDWAGEGWMLSENPLLLIDAQWLDAGTSDVPTTSWLVLDAHRSIPFQNIEGSTRYEAPPRFRATMEVFGGMKVPVSHQTGLPTGPASPGSPGASEGSKYVWWTEPTRAKVTLYDGALTYWFAIIPKDNKTASNGPGGITDNPIPGAVAGLIPPNRYFWDYLSVGARSWLNPLNTDPPPTGSAWVWGDYSERAYHPERMRALCDDNTSDYRFGHAAFWPAHGGQGNTPNYPGFGLPRVALLTSIQDRAGNEVHIEYVDTRTKVLDDPDTNRPQPEASEIEYVQDGQSIGQIKAVHLVNNKVNRGGGIASAGKEVSWTLLYIHRSTPGIAKGTPEYVINEINRGAGADRELIGLHGQRVLDRVLAYKGGLSRAVLDDLDAAALTIGVEDKSGFFGQTPRVIQLLAGAFGNEPAGVLGNWEHEVRYQYLLNPTTADGTTPSNTSWINGTWSSDSISPQALLVATRMTSRSTDPGSTTATSATPKTKTRLFVNRPMNQSSFSTALAGWVGAPYRDPDAPAGDNYFILPMIERGAFAGLSWGEHWLEGILEPDDVAALLQDIAKAKAAVIPPLTPPLTQWPSMTLKEAAMLRWYTTGLPGANTQPFSDQLVERMLRFASQRFGSQLPPPNDAFMPTRDQMTASLGAPNGDYTPAYVQMPKPVPGSTTGTPLENLLESSDLGTVTEMSLKVGSAQKHYRLMRFLRTPAFTRPGGANTWIDRPMPSAFLNPYTWWPYIDSGYQDWTGINFITAAVASTTGGAASPLTNPRFIVVIDEFASRNEMFARAEGTNDDPVGADVPGTTYRVLPGEYGASKPNTTAVLPGQLSRRVVEINAWGNILRERRWDFKANGTAFTSEGVGEDFVYKTPVQLRLVPEVQPGDTSTPWATKQFAQELLLVEKKSFGNSVATNGGTGDREGLIEFSDYKRVDGSTASPTLAELDGAPWSSRVQMYASGIRRGTNGTKIYRSQRFFESEKPWAMTGEVKFLKPETDVLRVLPSRGPPGTDGEPRYSTTWTKVYYDPEDSRRANELPIGQWRVMGRLVIESPRQQRPNGDWYYPFSAEVANEAGEMLWSVAGLVRNPMDPADSLNVNDPLASVVVSWKSSAVMPWATVADLNAKAGETPSSPSTQHRQLKDPSTGGDGGVHVIGHSRYNNDYVNDNGVPNALKWGPLPAGRVPVELVTISEYSYGGDVSDSWTQAVGGPTPGELKRRTVRGVVAKNLLDTFDINGNQEDDPEDDRLVEFVFDNLRLADGSQDRRNGPFVTQTKGQRRVYNGPSRESGIQLTEQVAWRDRIDFTAVGGSSLIYDGSVEQMHSEGISQGGVQLRPCTDCNGVTLKYEVTKRVVLTLDSFGRPQKVQEMEWVNTGGGAGGWQWLAVGSKLINDLGEVYREYEMGGNVTRLTRDSLGHVVRRYVGTSDERWGIERTGTGTGAHNMVLRESWSYGTGVNDIYRPIAHRRYVREPEWASQSYYNDPQQQVNGPTTAILLAQHSVSTLTTYDWRGRAVRVDEHGIGDGTTIGERFRTTLTLYDHGDRVRFVAVYGPKAGNNQNNLDVPRALDPAQWELAQGFDTSGSMPAVGLFYTSGLRPLSLTENVYNVDGSVLEVRSYDMEARTNFASAYQAERTYFGFMGKEVYAQSPGGPVRETLLDGLGRVEKMISRAPGAPNTMGGRELERTEYQYDVDGRVVEEKRFERVNGLGDVLANTNSAVTRNWTWYDTEGRVIARADLGASTGSSGSGSGQPQRPTNVVAAPQGLENPESDIQHESLRDNSSVAGAKVWINGYNRAGKLVAEVAPSRLRTYTWWKGDKKIRQVEAAGANLRRQTTWRYEVGRLVAVDTGPEGAFAAGTEGVSVGYGADVVDDRFDKVVSRDNTAIGVVWTRSSEPNDSDPLVEKDSMLPAQEKARLRYYLDGKLAERIDPRGVGIRYYYDREGRLSGMKSFLYPKRQDLFGEEVDIADPMGVVADLSMANQGSPSLPGVDGPTDLVDGVSIAHKYVTDSHGISRAETTISASYQRAINLAAPVANVQMKFDANGQLLSDAQEHGRSTFDDTSPKMVYAWTRRNQTNDDAGSTRLAWMGMPVHETVSRRMLMQYGSAGSEDDRLDRLTGIDTRLDTIRTTQNPVLGSVRGVARFAYGGISRRVSTILGPHSSTGSGDASTTLDTDTTKVGLEGLDRFGRRVDVHWKGSNGSTLRRDQMGYDAGDRMVYALVTQAPELTPAAAVKSRSALHTYDLLGRLIASKFGTLTLETNIPSMPHAASWWNDSWALDYNGNWAGVPVGVGMQGEGSYGRVTTGQLDFFGTPWALPGADAAAEERKIRDALGQGSCIKKREGDFTGGAPGVPAGRFRYDPAGNLTCDGRFIYQYDSWSRLVEIRQVAVNAQTGKPVIIESVVLNQPTSRYAAGPVVKRFAYDGLGRLVRTLSPWPSPELFATSGKMYRSEHYYYDGMRRVAEVTTDPALSKAAAKATLPQEELATLAENVEMLAGRDSIDVPLTFESKQIDVPLTFESKQKNLTVPPAVYLSREYVWGPGDNGVDELLCQWAWPSRDVPWWVISNVSGDCVAMVTQATVGMPSRVAWQGAYDAYGQVIAARSIVSHPPLRAGHKGLFAERLDGGVAWLTGTPTLGDLDRGRLEPPATIVYHNRIRTLSPTLGRFLQSDPNASGVGLVSSVSMHGRSTLLSSPGVDLGSMTGDGGNLYQYTQSNPMSRSDPTGLFSGFDAYMEYNEGVAEHGNDLSTYATDLLEGYAENQEELAEAALDWNTSDRDFSMLLGVDVGPEDPRTRRGGGNEPPGSRFATGGMFAAIGLESALASGGDGPAVANSIINRAAKVARRAAKASGWFSRWIAKGPKNVNVYIRPPGDYVGITNDLNRRGLEHGKKLVEIASGLTRNQARAIETLLIKNNARFTNSMKSISNNHRHVQKAEQWAIEYCQRMGIAVVR